jgi:hypothetical protein
MEASSERLGRSNGQETALALFRSDRGTNIGQFAVEARHMRIPGGPMPRGARASCPPPSPST